MANEQADEKQQFDYQGFVKEMAAQAESVVPVDMNPEQKKYITKMVYNFCNIACEAILNEEHFTKDDAALITQFIGEWTFHKSIDLLRAGIAQQPRDNILHNIASTVYEIAKLAVSKKMSQPEIIRIIEHHVKKTYVDGLTKLREQELISPEDYDRAMGESNIDRMAEEQDIQGMDSEFSTTKILKLASFAMILQKMPHEKVKSILSKIPEREQVHIKNYMENPDLSAGAGDETFKKYLIELKANVPKALQINEDKLQNKFSKIVTNKNAEKINAIMLTEREGVKEYISAIKEKRESNLSPRVSNVIYTYLAEKIK